MNEDARGGTDFFGAPPFRPTEALLELRRTLRAVGGLTERGQGFEWKGRSAVTLIVDGAMLQVQLARRPALSPEWESRTLKDSAAVRKFGDDVKRRVTRWKDADD